MSRSSNPPHEPPVYLTMSGGVAVPADLWWYNGDGEWLAISSATLGEQAPRGLVGRRATGTLPIGQLPADGLITYIADFGQMVTQRVLKGKVQ